MLKPKEQLTRCLEFFEGRGTQLKQYPLIRAAYYDETERAKDILAKDPGQLNLQDPFAGLTALHIAIFRQNTELVELLTKNPEINDKLLDNFDRRAVDMLAYTSNQKIFDMVTQLTYAEALRELDDIGYEDAKQSGKVVPLKPKNPS